MIVFLIAMRVIIQVIFYDIIRKEWDDMNKHVFDEKWRLNGHFIKLKRGLGKKGEYEHESLKVNPLLYTIKYYFFHQCNTKNMRL